MNEVRTEGASRGAEGASRTRFVARLGATLGAPFTLALCVVVLVAGVGAFATTSSFDALRRAERARADAWRSARVTALRAALDHAFGVADPLLDRLAASVRHRPSSAESEALVPVLFTLTTARPGLTWASVSYPDGTFVGISRAPDGGFHAQESRIVGDASVVRRLAIDALGGVHEISRGTSTYDPRSRAFYREALRSGHRVWTAPYAFLPSLHTGLSRVEPLYRDDADAASLLAVMTIDFDAMTLTTLLGDPLVPDQRTLVVTSDGVVLASQGVRTTDALAGDVRRWQTIDDPVVTAMRDAHVLTSRSATHTLDVAGAPFRADVARVAALDGRAILLVTAASEAALYEDASAQARRGALATFATSLVGLALAIAISTSIASLRRKRAHAEDEARAAKAQVTALGRYELVARIGAGAMGEVYRARHTLLARDAALKLIKPSDDDDDDDDRRRARFFEEARTLASLHSLHTVSVHDFGVAGDGRYFLVMELLDGLDLDTLVRRHGRQPPARVAAILAQICDSLAEAHDAGLVHQDIKPANVFLCRLAEALDFVKVLDFGLTRVVSHRAQTLHRLEGTPAFMSPEQIVGEPVGPQADLYALGGVGYFLLTGRAPFATVDRISLLEAHVNAPIPSLPDDVAQTTPAALTMVLTRCLAKRPQMRPSSARVLAEVFREIARDHADTFPHDALARFWATLDDGAEVYATPTPATSVVEVRLDAAHTERVRPRA